MELTKKELNWLRNQVSEGASLEELLQKSFPDADIAIIRGLDRFEDYASYIHGAYFIKMQAGSVMERIPPNGDPDIKDMFYIITATVREIELEIEQGRVKSGRKRPPLDDFGRRRPLLDDLDKMMIYFSLEKHLMDYDC